MISTVPLPKNGTSLPKNSTLVKISYISINPVDYKLPENFITRLSLGSKILCSDYAGTVVATTLPHLKPGDKVFGQTVPPAFSAAAEYAVLVGKDTCIPVPNGLPLDQAACIGVAGLTAYECIAPYVKAGDKVLINGGSGGTGTFGIQIAKALGCWVTTTCSGANAELCRSLGADEVIAYRTEPLVPALKRSGTQFDLIVDSVFADSTLYFQSHHYLKPGRPYVSIAGEFTLRVVQTMLTVFLLPAWLRGGQRTFNFLSFYSDAEGYNRVAQWMAEGKVKAVIEKQFDGLERLGEAFGRLKSGRTRRKLVVKI